MRVYIYIYIYIYPQVYLEKLRNHLIKKVCLLNGQCVFLQYVNNFLALLKCKIAYGYFFLEIGASA